MLSGMAAAVAVPPVLRTPMLAANQQRRVEGRRVYPADCTLELASADPEHVGVGSVLDI
jgi:hypothetical protein